MAGRTRATVLFFVLHQILVAGETELSFTGNVIQGRHLMAPRTRAGHMHLFDGVTLQGSFRVTGAASDGLSRLMVILMTTRA